MELGKPSALSVAAWFALIAIVIYLIFVATHKSDSEKYSGDASKTENTVNISPNEYQLVRCGQLFGYDKATLNPTVKK